MGLELGSGRVVVEKHGGVRVVGKELGDERLVL